MKKINLLIVIKLLWIFTVLDGKAPRDPDPAYYPPSMTNGLVE